MAPAGLEAGVLVSLEVEALPVRRAGVVPRVVVGMVAACSMLGLLAWSCFGGPPEGAPAASSLSTPALAYDAAYITPPIVPFKLPFKLPLPTMRRSAVSVMQDVEP